MYTFNSRVRYTEMNHRKGTLDLSSIINYFQDTSTFQSEDINRGLTYLQSKKMMWLLNSWQLVIKKPARLGDYITVGTWAYDFKGFYGYRNFIMKDKDGEILSAANSVWVYMDTENGRPVRVPTGYNDYEMEPAFPMDYADRKIEIPDNLVTHPFFPVVKSNIDSYNHVNNGQYIKMAEEFLPEDFMVRQMRVEYRAQAKLGDIIVPMISNSDNLYTVVLADSSHRPYAILEFQGTKSI
jgi:medium-chain acyl-[acyl-carrier-protein] hydrolase